MSGPPTPGPHAPGPDNDECQGVQPSRADARSPSAARRSAWSRSSFGFTLREVERLVAACKDQGAAGLVSRKRGVPSTRKRAPEVSDLALKLVRGQYAERMGEKGWPTRRAEQPTVRQAALARIATDKEAAHEQRYVGAGLDPSPGSGAAGGAGPQARYRACGAETIAMASLRQARLDGPLRSLSSAPSSPIPSCPPSAARSGGAYGRASRPLRIQPKRRAALPGSAKILLREHADDVGPPTTTSSRWPARSVDAHARCCAHTA
jgi:hypothetical protein